VVSALGEVINDGVIHPEEKVKVKAHGPIRILSDSVMNQESYIRRGQQSLSSNCCRNHGMYSQTNSFPLRGLLVGM